MNMKGFFTFGGLVLYKSMRPYYCHGLGLCAWTEFSWSPRAEVPGF